MLVKDPTEILQIQEDERWKVQNEVMENIVEIKDEKLDRPCIAKNTSQDLETAQRIAGVMNKLSEETFAVPKVYSLIQYKDSYWIVMEKVEGPNLQEFMESSGDVTVEQFLFLFHEMSTANAFLLNDNVLHNDVAFRNIILDSNHKFYPRLIDFNLVLSLNAESAFTTPLSPTETQFEHPLYRNVTVQSAVSELISTFEDALSVSKNKEMSEPLKAFFMDLRHTTKPKTFEELSSVLRSRLKMNEEQVSAYRTRWFME